MTDGRKDITISLRITPALKLRLDRAAVAEKRSVSNILTLAAEEWLARQGRDAGE